MNSNTCLVDNGTRELSETGAMRESNEGRGRCDLLTLHEVGTIISDSESDESHILNCIDNYIRLGYVNDLYAAIEIFIKDNYPDRYTALLELSKHYEQGALKYADRNWEKGIKLHSFINSGVRHYLKFKRGDQDEPHDRAFLWNMFGAIWTHNNKPEMIDLPFKEIEK